MKETQSNKINRNWYEIDASSDTYGRIASRVASILRGKHKRSFTPHIDAGDFVVAVNVDKLKFSGRKMAQKKYYRHSGYLGGLKTSTLQVEYIKHPEKVFQRAVYNMLDDLKFRKTLISRLKLVKGKEHQFKIDKKL
jgi:large subunit ribosomal protein L13